MNTFEFNKIAGAVLVSLLVLLGVKSLADYLYTTPAANPKAFPVEIAAAPESGEAPAEAKPAQAEAAPAEAAPAEAAAPAAGEASLPALLAQADVAAARRRPRNARPATISRKVRAPRSAPIFTALSAARWPAPKASNIRRR